MQNTKRFYVNLYNTELDVELAFITSPSLNGLSTFVFVGLGLAGVAISGSAPTLNKSPIGALFPKNLFVEAFDVEGGKVGGETDAACFEGDNGG